MESWEDLIKTLPTDETLEQKEKSGELKDIDRRIAELILDHNERENEQYT